MSIKQVQVKINDLSMGMFVSKLDRPWTQTPFPIQGFLIRSPQDIDTLRSYCEYVYIDVTKGRALVSDEPLKPIFGRKVAGAAEHSSKTVSIKPPAPLKVDRGVYRVETPLRTELTSAQRALSTLKGNMALFAKQLSKGRPVDYQSLRLSVNAMVASVLRCPDAFTWLLRLRQKDQQSFDHSMRSALWAVQFARFIGMPKDEIEVLCTGTLLKDIGKMRVPNEVLNKRERTGDDEREYRRFVEYSVEMLQNTHEVESKVISVVRYHCERFDGSGFPEGLVGSKIPLLAQICGVASCYDAISNPRESSHPLSASRAISMIYDMRDRQFREDLVLQFIQSIGLYPTGTLVQLTTGDMGVVVEQDPKSRLTPQVAVLLDGSKEKGFLIDLKDEQKARQLLAAKGRVKARTVSKLAIARDLESSGFDIDINAVSPAFISASASEDAPQGLINSVKSRWLKRS